VVLLAWLRCAFNDMTLVLMVIAMGSLLKGFQYDSLMT